MRSPRGLSDALVRLLRYEARRGAPQPRAWLGLEHEFNVLDGRGHPVDFRHLIDEVAAGTLHLNPHDAFGRRLPSGSWLTSDGAEAEVAIPPLAVSHGFARRLHTAAAAERSALATRLSSGLRLAGYSTHLSVSAPPALSWRASRTLAEVFAVALMLLIDGPASPGLLVRPRPGRVEIGGDYVDGARLGAAGALAAGAVLACLAAAVDPWAAAALPPRIQLDLEPARQRYGWFAGRGATGSDLYSLGREAVLRTATGRRVLAGDHLRTCWDVARRSLRGVADAADLELCDGLVSGLVPLAVERPDAQVEIPVQARPAADGLDGGGFETVAETRLGAAADVAPVLTAWDLSVFVVADPARSRHAFAAVPRLLLPAFERRFDRGDLDPVLASYLERPPTGRRLASHGQALRGGLFDLLGSRRALLAPELLPEGQR